MMEPLVYLLGFFISVSCSALLIRGYSNGRQRLLLWSGLCFALLALNNFILCIDLVIIPDIDISGYRSLPALAGVAVLLFGLVWEVK